MTYFWIMLVSLLGTQATYSLARHTKMGPVRASALPALVFVAASSPFPFLLIPQLQAAFFGATFVGMSDSSRLGNSKVLFAGAVYGVIFSVLVHFRSGIGGTLGASAFVSCLLVYWLARKTKELARG